MPEVEFLCPHHGAIEKVEMPESYERVGFTGQILCGAGTGRKVVSVRILVGGAVVEANRVETITRN